MICGMTPKRYRCSGFAPVERTPSICLSSTRCAASAKPKLGAQVVVAPVWCRERSQMAELAGKFAGIVVVSVPDERTDDLTAELDTLTAQGLLDVTVAIAANDGPTDHDDFLQLHLIGQDRPGIIREIAGALAQRNVSIEELETSASSAPMSGEASRAWRSKSPSHRPAVRGVPASTGLEPRSTRWRSASDANTRPCWSGARSSTSRRRRWRSRAW